MKKRRYTYQTLLEEINDNREALLQEGKSEVECRAYELNAKLTLAIHDFLCRCYVGGTLAILLLLGLLIKLLLEG